MLQKDFGEIFQGVSSFVCFNVCHPACYSNLQTIVTSFSFAENEEVNFKLSIFPPDLKVI